MGDERDRVYKQAVREQRRKRGKIAPISMSDTADLCTLGAKCIRKDGHEGECWPK